MEISINGYQRHLFFCFNILFYKYYKYEIKNIFIIRYLDTEVCIFIDIEGEQHPPYIPEKKVFNFSFILLIKN